MRPIIIIFVIVAAIIGGIVLYRVTCPITPLAPLSAVHTLIVNEAKDEARFDDPFGVVVAPDNMIYMTDGETNRLWQISPDNTAKVITENLETPSAVALSPDGTLVVADSGSHTIKRIDPQTGRVTIIAGAANQFGFADGSLAEARFNAPVGVAVNRDGVIFVADTYNDSVRVIDVDKGIVQTLAGTNEPGFVDAPVGADARFDTPCGIAVAGDGTLVVADTGNHRLRRVAVDGAVSTLAGNSDAESYDGTSDASSFNEPIGVAVGVENEKDGDTENRQIEVIYVTDAGGATLKRVSRDGETWNAATLTGGAPGFADGAFADARFNHLSGIAVAPDGTLVVADTGNKLLRVVVGQGRERGEQVAPGRVAKLYPNAAEIRSAAPPRWPFDPPEKPREIAATFGEIRGEIAEDKSAWFHNGLDIPGAYGETVRAVRGEKVLRPMAVEDAGTRRERIRLPVLGYIHLRVGRNQKDEAFDDRRFIVRRDAEGHVADVRVRRGTQFATGDPLGTLNDQYHVHLIAGPVSHELNALAALELPGIKDTVAPTLENQARLFSFDGQEFGNESALDESKPSAQQPRKRSNGKQPNGNNSSVNKPSVNEPIKVHGDVRIIVEAYDQMDGNAARRRLGVYQLGYQVLNSDGTPAPGFTEPRLTISFEDLPDDSRSVPFVYYQGSGAGYRGTTVFAYIVTNRVRNREAREEFWQTSQLSSGDYILRVFAEDFFGNRTTKDTLVRVAGQQ